MKIVWCKDLEGVVNIARSQGWLFYNKLGGKHYYYIYAGIERELLCIAVESKEPLKAKYVTIGDEGNIKISENPIMPACARITNVAKDDVFEEFMK